jgi:hypothetical protein
MGEYEEYMKWYREKVESEERRWLAARNAALGTQNAPPTWGDWWARSMSQPEPDAPPDFPVDSCGIEEQLEGEEED